MAELPRGAWTVYAKELMRRGVKAVERSWIRVLPASMRSERNHYRHVHPTFTFGPEVRSSSKAVDAAYVLAEKDLATLGPSLRSLRRFLRHPIVSVYVISAPSKAVQSFCLEQDCQWIDERELMGFGPESIRLQVQGHNRSGWLYQQLIKLSLDSLAPSRPIYVLDADTLLVSPQVFEFQGKTVMLVSDERHLPYRRAYQRLLDQHPAKDFSFVAHQMMFSPQRLHALRAQIEQRHPGRIWWQAIIDSYEPGALSGFSEFETYGNWMASHFPGEIIFEYWANRRLPRAWLNRAEHCTDIWAGTVRSVSFHAHDN